MTIDMEAMAVRFHDMQQDPEPKDHTNPFSPLSQSTATINNVGNTDRKQSSTGGVVMERKSKYTSTGSRGSYMSGGGGRRNDLDHGRRSMSYYLVEL